MLDVNCIEHTFTVELKSKRYVQNISISDQTYDLVLFEGNLGKLLELSLAEGDVLEFVGVHGILRISVTLDQLQKALREVSKSNLSSEVGSYKNTKKKEVKK